MRHVYLLPTLLLIALLPLLSLRCMAQVDSNSLPCNGHPELCAKRFNEVVYPATHNAFNAGRAKHQRFTYPNQRYDIPQQLADGVRGFMVDIHYYNGPNKKLRAKRDVLVFHAYAVLGHEPFGKVLKWYKDFMDAHPREVITLMLESSVDPKDVKAEFEKAGLVPYLYSQTKGAVWPTLGEMIASGKRMVVFGGVSATDGWQHKEYDYYMENPYTNKSWRKYNCNMMVGPAPYRLLYTFNHFLTGTFARRHKNKVANSYSILMPRVQQCMAQQNQLINFLTVDWYHWGDLFKVVDELNHVPPPAAGYHKRR